MDFLVTGSNGFVGKNVTNYLRGKGADVRITPRCNFDLNDMAVCEWLVRDVKTIFHFAGFTGGAKILSETPNAYARNSILNINIMEAAHKAGVENFVFISSSVVYPEHALLSEENAHVGNPPNCYYGPGHMKRYGETLAMSYHFHTKPKMRCTIIRPGNIYGPHNKFGENANVLSATIRKVVDQDYPLVVWGDGEDLRDFIYIDDFIEGMMIACDSEEHMAWNVASGTLASVKDVLEIAMDWEDYHPEIVYDASKPSMIRRREIDTSRIERAGFKCKMCLEDGIAETIQWYKELRC